MRKKALLSLLLISNISIAGDGDGDGENRVFTFIRDFCAHEDVQKGTSTARQKIVSNSIYLPLAIIGVIIYKKWGYNKDDTGKRVRIKEENDGRINMIKYLDYEISRLQKKIDLGPALSKEELQNIEEKTKMRKVIDRALMDSQFNHLKPSEPSPDGTLYEQGKKFFKVLPG